MNVWFLLVGILICIWAIVLGWVWAIVLGIFFTGYFLGCVVSEGKSRHRL